MGRDGEVVDVVDVMWCLCSIFGFCYDRGYC